MNPLSDSYFAAIKLISTLSAYFAAYGLMRRVFSRSALAILGQSISARQEWLFGVVSFTWVALVMLCGSRGEEKGELSAGSLTTEAMFLVVLGGCHFVRLLTGQQAEFFLSGSLLYVPFTFLLCKAGLAIKGSGQLIRDDPRILVIGSRERAKDAIERIRRANKKADFIGCLDPDPSSVGTSVADVKVLGTVTTFPEFLFAQSIDLVLFAMPPDLVPNAKTMIDAALEIGVPVSVVLDSGLQRLGYGLDRQFAEAQQNAVLATATLSTIHRNQTYLVFKRMFDIAVSGIILILLAPLFLALGVLIKLTSPNGPVFYRWKVLGQNRRPFVGYKFRTMVPNADQLKEKLMQQNEMTGPVFKMRNDPRITPLGRILRKYSIDELPQLYSVLKGDMSLVGPRPPSKQEADQFEFWQRRKLSVRPGITCLWQVNGRSKITSFDEWARLDLEYISRASLAFDFAILLRTIPVVIRGSGAH